MSSAQLFRPLVAPLQYLLPRDRAEVAAVKPRQDSVDAMRLLATAAVVFLHGSVSQEFEPLRNLARFAVPFYLFAALHFFTRSLTLNAGRSPIAAVAGRLRSLFLPFAAWSVIYLILRDVKRTYVSGQSALSLSPELLWTGGQYHLWFLPFLLTLTCVAAVVHWLIVRKQIRWLRWPIIGATFAAALAFAVTPVPAGWSPDFEGGTYALIRWWWAAPAACGAFAFVCLTSMGDRIVAIPRGLGSLGFAITLVAVVLALADPMNLFARAMGGFGCALIALAPWSSRSAAVASLASIGRHSYGIYLSHVLFVEVIRVISIRLDVPASPVFDVLSFVLSFSGATVFSLAIARTKRLAWLCG